MQTILGDCVLFELKDGNHRFMRVEQETKTTYRGYDEERINYTLDKKLIVKIKKFGVT